MEVSDETFEELKREAIKIWRTYDNQFGYADEKVGRIDSISNVRNNFGTIIGMFDFPNQQKLFKAVGPEARDAIRYWSLG